ncbi:MAG: hypothetical protein ABI183_23815 [Polyangiaceae bacterium]
MRCAIGASIALIFIISCASTPAHDLTACTSPPAPPAGSSCSVGSAYLMCTFEGDAGVEIHENCVSDNINVCPDGNGLGGCNDVCPGEQYAAVCPSNDPPSPRCTLTSGVYCCPC